MYAIHISGFVLRTQEFMVVPSNVEALADYIFPHVDITETVIHFNLRESSGLLLRVPIETPDSAIVIRLGTNSSYLNTHPVRMRIGVSDLDNINSFYIVDRSLYLLFPPCDPHDALIGDHPLVSAETRAPSTFTFILLPWDRLGYCETAQNGGYTSFGKFYNQLKSSKPWYLELEGTSRAEDVYITYIAIQSI